MTKISVIGSGTMGNGIAHVFAQSGFKVTLMDIAKPQLDKALQTISKNLDRQIAKNALTEEQKKEVLGNITITTDMAEAAKTADLLVEAVTENYDLKLKLFKQFDELAPAGAILASNTSSISITRIAAVTKRPDHVIGMHFINPVPVMKLVEVINGYLTSDEVTKTIKELAKKIGKIACISKDYPSFTLNRILLPMLNEAMYTLQEGVAGVEDIDVTMKLGAAHPMGPLQLADFIGLDTCLSILNIMYTGFGNPKYAPCPILVNMVAAGNLGVKSGEGFYVYTPGSKDLVVSSRFR
jgi:3-hydroxybutyryl-CoA dehydrogenase